MRKTHAAPKTMRMTTLRLKKRNRTSKAVEWAQVLVQVDVSLDAVCGLVLIAMAVHFPHHFPLRRIVCDYTMENDGYVT